MLKRRLITMVVMPALVANCYRTGPVLPTPLPATAFADRPQRDMSRFRVRDSVHRAALLDTLAAQERLWGQRRPPHYEYAIMRLCGCFGDLMYRPYIVRVDENRSDVFNADGHLVPRDPVRAAVLSIETLFADIRRDIESGTPYVQVSYDRRFGFPKYSVTDYPGISDSFFEATVRQFRIR